MDKKGIIKAGAGGISALVFLGLVFLAVFSAPGEAVIEKEIYSLGEKVRISLERSAESVKIETPSTAYLLDLKGRKRKFIFEPEETGLYKAVVDYGGVGEEHRFEVVGREDPEEGESRTEARSVEGTERRISERKKEVVIGNAGGGGVLKSYAGLPKEAGRKDRIRIFWKEKGREVDFKAVDEDGNGFYDRVEWEFFDESSDEQTFEIIVITKAEHLDSDREFIEDIYEEVKERDGVWSPEILDGEYVRAVFEKELTSENDITIFPRVVSGKPRIEIYEVEEDEMVAEFGGVKSGEFNKVFLTGLNGKQDAFDLRVVEGSVEFDYIVDPLAFPGASVSLRPQTCSAEVEAVQGSFDDACDGTYPNACGSGLDLVSCNDSFQEAHSAKLDQYGGINLTYFNTTEGEKCSSITKVEVCYEWWADGGNLGDCYISVDNGDATFTKVVSSCPNIIPDPGIFCVDATSDEDWSCENFFGSSGGRAAIISEVDKSAAQGGGVTISWDSLFYNVTYEEDLTPPNLSISFPLNENYNFNVSELNYSVSSDAQACWYSLDGGLNNVSVACGINASGLTSNEGSNTWRVWANDSFGNVNSSTVTFSKDTLNPDVQYGVLTESNDSLLNRNNIVINITASDVNFANITIRLYNFSRDEIRRNVSVQTDFLINYTGLNDATYYFNATARDTFGNLNDTETREVRIDTTFPSITINNPEFEGINYSVSTVDFNITIDEDGDSAWYTLDGGANNVTMQKNGQRDFNHTNSSIADGVYTVDFYVNDTAGNVQNASRSFGIDTVNPDLVIREPQNISYSRTGLEINFSVSDLTLGVQSCWYSDDDGATNFTLVGCANTSYTVGQGSTTLRLYANDSAGNVNNSESVTFFVDSVNPGIEFLEPLTRPNGTTFSQDYIPIEVSVTESNFANITYELYNETNGGTFVNRTVFNTLVTDFNWTDLNQEDVEYYYNVSVADTTGNVNFTETRTITLSVADLEPPVIIIVSPSTEGEEINNTFVDFNVSLDENGTAWYSLNYGASNFSMIGDENGIFGTEFNASNSSIAPGDYEVVFYANDTSGNSGSKSRNFTILHNTSLVFSFSKSPVEILEEFDMRADYTYVSNSSAVGGAQCILNDQGFSRFVLGTGDVLTSDANGTGAFDIYGNNTLVVNVTGIPIHENSTYDVISRIHRNNVTTDALRVYFRCDGNSSVDSKYKIGEVNGSSGFFGSSFGESVIFFNSSFVAGSSCYVIYESQNSTNVSGDVWHVANLDGSGLDDNVFSSTDFGESISAEGRVGFVDVGYTLTDKGLRTMSFNSSTRLYELRGVHHGSSGSFVDSVSCSADGVIDRTDNETLDVEDNTNPRVQIAKADPNPAEFGVDNVSVEWSVNDLQLEERIINVTYPNGSLLLETSNESFVLSLELLSVEGNYSVYGWANDSAGNTGNDSAVLEVKRIFPLVEFGNGTEANGTSFNRTWVYVNVSVVESNFANITYELYNTTGLVNRTIYSTLVLEINWTGLFNGNADYFYNVSVVDLGGNSNSTETRTITLLDNEFPSWGDQNQTIDGVYVNKTHHGEGLNLSASWSDGSALGSARLSTNEGGQWANLSGAYGSPQDLNGLSDTSSFIWDNSSVSPGENVSWRIYVNDSSGNLNFTDVFNFTVWGFSEISSAYFDPSGVQLGENSTFYCEVGNNVTSEKLVNYNISFYNSTNDFIGSNLTGAGGVASIFVESVSEGAFTYTCNISDFEEIYYDASANNEGSAIFSVGFSSRIYTYDNLTFHKAFEGTTNTTTTQIDESYSTLVDNDNLTQEFTAGEGLFAYTRYEMKIDEFISDMTFLNITWRGYGDAGGAATDGFVLWVYNNTAGEYSQYASYSTDETEQLRDLTYTDGFSEIVNSTGWVIVLARTFSSAPTTGSQGDRITQIATDQFNIEVRSDIISPDIVLNYPSDELNLSVGSFSFNCSADDDYDVVNVSLYGNWSSGWHRNETNSSGLENRDYLFNKTMNEGKFLWSCEACDRAGNCGFNVFNFTFRTDFTAPNVNLLYPANLGNVTGVVVEQFNYSVNDVGHINNCSLYGNWTGVFEVNQSVDDVAKDVVNNFSSADVLDDGYYDWNVECTDNVGNVGRNLTNFTFAAFNIPYFSPNLTVANQTVNDGMGNISLSWESVENAVSYRIYQASDLSGSFSFLNETSSLSYNDSTFAGSRRRFYQIRAWNPTGENSSDEIFGAHVYTLGHNGNTRNWIGFPSNASYLTDANSTLNEIRNATAFTMWNASIQGRVTCNEFSCPEFPSCTDTNCDFSLKAGTGYEVNVNSSAPSLINWSLVGVVYNPGIVELIKNETDFGKNWIAVYGNTTLKGASDLLVNISNSDAVSLWDYELQTSQGLINSPFKAGSYLGTNFSIELERAYEVSVTNDTNWTQV